MLIKIIAVPTKNPVQRNKGELNCFSTARSNHLPCAKASLINYTHAAHISISSRHQAEHGSKRTNRNVADCFSHRVH